MKEKKHIDRVFQERFKDFEVAPSDAVWDNIEAQLNQKKKKNRIIPIWWRYAGVAALLLLFLTIGGIYFYGTTTVTPTNQVVDTKEATPTKTNSTDGFKQAEQERNNNDTNTKNNTIEAVKNIKKEQNISTNSASSSAIAHTSSKVSSSNTNNSNTEKPKKDINQEPLIDKNNSIAVASKEKSKTEPDVDNSNNSIDITTKKQEVITNNVLIADAKNDRVDSATVATPETKTRSIEEALAEVKNSVEEENSSNSKWSLTPNAAPVYFNSLGKGSSLDSQFNNNSKSGEVNMSYGVIAGYTIAKNLKIRSGINKVNLGYNTNDVVVFESIGAIRSSSSIKNIAPAKPALSNDGAAPQLSIVSEESLNASKSNSFIKTSNTSINQSLGYIEIPLEIEYTLINKKIGVNVIGGFSSFFLNNNKLYSEFNGERTLIGKATNLNTISYSANFGLGLNYKMTKKFELNLEPLFKYQINTFNNTSGNFKPYIIGVYTGIGFKF
ncbi:hypothetical protein [Yeosuana marina]|uniref:hypothetical protein n=1 Tax=Yeosuana marina TaxID=1565536 RepID=UPI0030C8B96F